MTEIRCKKCNSIMFEAQEMDYFPGFLDALEKLQKNEDFWIIKIKCRKCKYYNKF